MIKVKHLLDDVEEEDGQRIWVESIGVTRDLQEWCKIDQVMTQLGPPKELWDWFNAHPDGYDYFRGRYHETISKGPHLKILFDLVTEGRRSHFTLLHQSDSPENNTAIALYEFLCELEAYVPPET